MQPEANTFMSYILLGCCCHTTKSQITQHKIGTDIWLMRPTEAIYLYIVDTDTMVYRLSFNENTDEIQNWAFLVVCSITKEQRTCWLEDIERI
jgi:hypothetical protein